ncbi:MAG: UDP-N-acetylmuramoyl-tripeptide--D-alanyl-D-alanine ligase [Vicinamibacterales bacterium]
MESFPLSATDVAQATGGQIVRGDPAASIERVSIDSRAVSPGDLYVAIHGERFDGHRFVGDALSAGAMGAVVHRPLPPQTAAAQSAVVIQVEDTTRALQALARDVRRRSGAKVVAITGSAGKTTTKEVAAEFLSARFRVFRNKGNLNNHIGLPLSLLELRSRPEIAVVELGMNHPGEIRTLVHVAEPELRVWTNVGDAHLGFFESAEAMADAKAEILESAKPDDVLVANADDPRVMARGRGFRGRLLRFGLGGGADVRATNVQHLGLEGMEADVTTPNGAGHLRTPLLGGGNLLNVLAAIAVGTHFGIDLAEMLSRAAHIAAAHHRGELLRLPGGVTLIDDSYNSSPAAVVRTLETVMAATGSARKVAVLGEMLELGAHSERLHRECGRAAAGAGLDLLIAVGGDAAAALAREAIAAGMPDRTVTYVGTKEEAADAALRQVRPGDLVVVKGSRGIGTDLVVDRLKQEFA